MTTTAKHLLSEIVAGLDGVLYGGTWEVGDLEQRRPYSPHFELMNATDIFARVYCGHNDPEEVRGTVAHISACSPDRIRAIAAYVEQLEKENRVLHELRRDLLTLQKRIIGETGLSAIETIDRALKVFEAAHLYEIFDEDRAALEAQPHSETRQEQR